ncbi:twin-arginine translocase TatA/TatE family subunit [bacterium]|nr:twin-arginine translocase TatA/TatE family subunit [bacterium]
MGVQVSPRAPIFSGGTERRTRPYHANSLATTRCVMGSLSWWEIGAIFIIILLLFGSKRLPDLARSVGKSIREFKKSLKEIESDVTSDDHEQKPDGKSDTK